MRDGLIISGWLATGFALIVVTSIVHSVGYDAYSYWSIDFSDLYGRAMSSNFALGAFRYAPPIAFLFGPFGALPWWLFLWLWEALMLALIAWLGGRWALVLLALPPVALELYHGNVHLLIAAAIVLGLRYPAAWSFVLLTKVTPGVGLLWFAVRREWRSLAIALGATAQSSRPRSSSRPTTGASGSTRIFSNLSEPQFYCVPPPAPIRLPIAALHRHLGRAHRPAVDRRGRRDPGPADHLAARPVRARGGHPVPAPRRPRRADARLARRGPAAHARAVAGGVPGRRARPGAGVRGPDPADAGVGVIELLHAVPGPIRTSVQSAAA